MNDTVEHIERSVYLYALQELTQHELPITTMDNLPLDLLQEAGMVALGIDHRDDITDGSKSLASIFNRFNEDDKKPDAYYPTNAVEDQRVFYPQRNQEAHAINDAQAVLHALLQKVDLSTCPLNTLAGMVETAGSYRPTKDLPDVSLYDHTKLTAAVAACLYLYGQEHAVHTYKSLRSEQAYLLVSGDLSGVQQFIYTIPSLGALKSLRGRSFYLDLLLEETADELLSQAGASRSCLLYTGGGHFYILLPNTETCRQMLQQFTVSINDWLLRHAGTRLYLAMAWTPCTAEEFMGITPGGSGAPFQRVSRALSREKLQRYSGEQLAQLFDVSSNVNHVRDNQRECSICHISTGSLEPYNAESPDTLACPSCRGLYRLGELVLRHDAFIVTTKNEKDAVPVPGFKRDLFLCAVDSSYVTADNPEVVRLYVKNKVIAMQPKAVTIWLADYVSRDEAGHVMEFGQLAELSGGSADAGSIERLGVLRADVDNLGAAFMAGVSTKYATWARTSTLSRSLSLFFKRYLPLICEGRLNMPGAENKKAFSLFSQTKAANRHVHVIYAGGDDLFLVGAWDDLIECAVDIRRAFAQFTNDKLSFSAGIGLFPAKCPVAILASQTGSLEDAAKDNPGKNSIALFGSSTEIKADSREADSPECFSWSQFTDKVVGDKLAFLREVFAMDALEEAAQPQKLRIGKGKLYNILSLLEAAEEDGGINLARFAYALARMEPRRSEPEKRDTYREVRERLYKWYQQEMDRKELYAAIELLIYHLRDKGVI